MLKLLKFLSPYKGKTALIIVLLFLQVLGTLYIPTLTADIVNNGIITGNMDHVWKTGGIMLIVAVLTACISIAGTWFSTFTFSAVGRDIRNALFEKSQALTTNEFNRIGPASMITRCTNDISQIQQGYTAAVEMLLPAPVMAAAGLILAFSKSPELTLIIVVFMVVVCLFTILLGKTAMPLFVRMQVQLDKINRILREYLTGIRVIRAFNRAEFEKNRIDKTSFDYADIAIRINKKFAVMIPVIMLIMNFCAVIMIGVGGNRVAGGQIQIGDIMALIEYSVLIMMYLIMGMMVFVVFPRSQSCANRVNEVFDIPIAADRPDMKHEIKKNVGQTAKLEFRNVTFQYQGAEQPVLSDISFFVRRGKSTAIIGGTGSGKSTIASLIPRLYDIQSGAILIDGINIVKLTKAELRKKISFVSQKAFLFSGTIADNLRHGKADATLEEMRHAAQIAQIDEFIMVQSKGYDAPVSQGGQNFSGGQRQRLSIVRALLKKPEIYVFDDSFSALDFKTDAKLRAALKDEIKESAAIIVAQRVSTIMDADQIVVLDQGRIAGIGTHRELLKNCPVYYQIASSQLSEEELT